MAYSIDKEKCINCGACIGECPTEAISAEETTHVIDPEKCIDCGACAGVCPVEAPSL
jgi:ferredoxin